MTHVEVPPTEEFCAKHQLVQGDNGTIARRYRFAFDMLLEDGRVNDNHEWAINQYCLMRATFEGVRTGTSLSSGDNDVPTLRDGYHHIQRKLKRRDSMRIELLTEDLQPSEAGYKAARRELYSNLVCYQDALDNLHDALRDFATLRKKAQDVVLNA